MHARNVSVGVAIRLLWLKLFPLVSYFMKRHSLWPYRRQKGGSTPRTLIPVWTLPLRHISSSLGVAGPFTNKVEKGWKKCTGSMVGRARSIAHYDACTPSSGVHPRTWNSVDVSPTFTSKSDPLALVNHC